MRTVTAVGRRRRMYEPLNDLQPLRNEIARDVVTHWLRFPSNAGSSVLTRPRN